MKCFICKASFFYARQSGSATCETGTNKKSTVVPLAGGRAARLPHDGADDDVEQCDYIKDIFNGRVSNKYNTNPPQKFTFSVVVCREPTTQFTHL